MTRCSIVIRALNEADHLGRLFEGLEGQTVTDREVILVDSGSSDGTVKIAEQHGARIVRIAPQEFSFGRSLNRGVAAARGDLVIIASAHVHPVYPDWLECLLGPFQDPRVALVYGKQRGTSFSRLSEHQIFRQWFPEVDSSDQSNPFCNNANAAIRRSLWEQHAYDEELTGLEDIAWAKWAQGQGYRVAYAAHAEIIHVHNESPRRVFERYRREGMAFKLIFPESHFSIYDCARLMMLNILRDLQLAAKAGGLWRHGGSILWFRSMQFWGTYQGYRQSSPLTQALRQTFYYPPGESGLARPRSGVDAITYKADEEK